jgi:creatinine deaminase
VSNDVEHMQATLDQARVGLGESGISTAAGLAVAGEIIATCRDRRVQLGNAIRHAETDCLENAGPLSAATYRRSPLYPSLSPCQVCAGAVLPYGIPRVVIGENQTFSVTDGTPHERGVALTALSLDSCISMKREFISAHPDLSSEGVGADGPDVFDGELSRSKPIPGPDHSLPKGNL